MVLYRQVEDNEDMNKLKGVVRKRYNWGVFGRLRVVLVVDGIIEDQGKICIFRFEGSGIFLGKIRYAYLKRKGIMRFELEMQIQKLEVVRYGDVFL